MAYSPICLHLAQPVLLQEWQELCDVEQVDKFCSRCGEILLEGGDKSHKSLNVFDGLGPVDVDFLIGL